MPCTRDAARSHTHRTPAVAVFVLMAFLFTFLVFDPNPLSTDPGAKAHARADIAFLTCKVNASASNPLTFHVSCAPLTPTRLSS